MVGEMDECRLHRRRKRIKVAIHPAPPQHTHTAGYYRPSSLISIPNQYASAAVKTAVNQSAAGDTPNVRRKHQRAVPNETPSVCRKRLCEDATAAE